MRYRKLTGVVLKKQNYKEADQIVTVWTKQAGKVRCLARALRSAKSKLSYAVQPLSLVEVELAEKHDLPTLVSAKNIRLFPRLREDLVKTGLGFFAEELMLKMTPDEQKNEPAYGLLVDFLGFIEEATGPDDKLRQALDCFTLRLLAALGYSVEHAAGSFRMPAQEAMVLRQLSTLTFGRAAALELPTGQASLVHKGVIRFAEYILERNIRSDSFLTQI